MGAYAFLHVPLLILAVFSFNSSKFTVWQGFSLQWYSAMLQDRDLIEASANSLIIGPVATILATVCGTLAAYALWKKCLGLDLRLRCICRWSRPKSSPASRCSRSFNWAFRFLNLRLGMHTVILAHVGFSLAYVVVVVLARLRTFDPALEEAAMDLGATEFGAFSTVTLPYLAPAIAAAAMLAFTVSIDDYVITSLVAGVDSQTLPMVIYASPAAASARC